MRSDHLEEVRNYWNLRSHGFSNAVNEEIDSPAGEAWKETFRELFGGEPLEVLDDGAGPGFFTMILCGLGHRVTAIDYSEDMTERIHMNLDTRGMDARILRMDAQRLDFADGSFDAVVQRNVLWNLDEPEKAYAEIFRVLRPGGACLIDDGNFYLWAHDDEYAEATAARRAEYKEWMEKGGTIPGDHYNHNPENVDFRIIDEIAVKQPLARERRPQWDIDRMIRLGFRDIHVEIEGTGLPQHFRITARKPE